MKELRDEIIDMKGKMTELEKENKKLQDVVLAALATNGHLQGKVKDGHKRWILFYKIIEHDYPWVDEL